MTDLKIYDDDKRLEGALIRLRNSQIPKRNKELILAFISDCDARGSSFSRQSKYADHLWKIAE